MVLGDIESKWQKILKIIESKNSKTANFLLESIIDSFNENLLNIKVNKVSNFIFKGLLKDVILIEEAIFELFNKKIKVNLIEGDLEKNKNDKSSSKQDEQHPLFMDVLNKFEGEVLR